jgi:hypothetical protein
MIRLFPLRSLWTRCLMAANDLAERMAALTDPQGGRQMVRVPAKAHSRTQHLHGPLHRQMRPTRTDQRMDR